MNLPSLTHPNVASYRGGYNRRPYDITSLVSRLLHEGTSPASWEEVWDELYHQGDVGEATFALVPFLVEHIRTAEEIDPMAVAFVVTVELDRETPGNPPVPPELWDVYRQALHDLPLVALSHPNQRWNEELVMYVAATVALAHEHRQLARAYCEFDTEQAASFIGT
jgi:hypothetical protein